MGVVEGALGGSHFMGRLLLNIPPVLLLCKEITNAKVY